MRSNRRLLAVSQLTSFLSNVENIYDSNTIPPRQKLLLLLNRRLPKDALNASGGKPQNPIKSYLGSPLSIEVPNRPIPNSKFLVSGRIDWTIGYSWKDEDGALSVAMEGEREIGVRHRIVTTHRLPAIFQENRRRAGKINKISKVL